MNQVLKGSLTVRFNCKLRQISFHLISKLVCFRLLDLDEDQQINKSDFGKLLKTLHKFYFKEDANKDFAEFVDMTWSKAGKNNDELMHQDAFVELVINKPILSSYWNLNDIEL